MQSKVLLEVRDGLFERAVHSFLGLEAVRFVSVKQPGSVLITNYARWRCSGRLEWRNRGSHQPSLQARRVSSHNVLSSHEQSRTGTLVILVTFKDLVKGLLLLDINLRVAPRMSMVHHLPLLVFTPSPCCRARTCSRARECQPCGVAQAQKEPQGAKGGCRFQP